MNVSQELVISPCIRKCCLNEQDVCLGCFRSLAEITGWADADNVTRRVYLANTEKRRIEYSQKYKINW